MDGVFIAKAPSSTPGSFLEWHSLPTVDQLRSPQLRSVVNIAIASQLSSHQLPQIMLSYSASLLGQVSDNLNSAVQLVLLLLCLLTPVLL